MCQHRLSTGTFICATLAAGVLSAQTGPQMLTPSLSVDTVVTGLDMPTSMAVVGPFDFLVLEKNTGKVKRVRRGAISQVLDLGVNFSSERGLLGIALEPNFAASRGVYLYWTCRSTTPPADPFFPSEQVCLDDNMFASDTDNILQVPLRGNRVDRFVWNGSTLTYDKNIIMLRAFQSDGAPVPPGQGDEGQPPRGNHDGGTIAFGLDGKLYILIGDVGRRGQLQNLPSGPTLTGLGPTVPDDQFGGPAPDNAHFTGVIIRLNPDGSAPTDNPFYGAGGSIGGEVGANIQKTFAYGIRNSFGMTFDPLTGNLWASEHGDDAFDEINLIRSGMNGGWIQIMGPDERIAQYKAIELSLPGGLQQLRWPPERIADTPAEALSRLFALPGSMFTDPEFSWKYAALPVGMAFAPPTFGPEMSGDLFVGVVGPPTGPGYLFKFDLAPSRQSFVFSDPRLSDRVADNSAKYDFTESESLVIGSGFGIITDIEASVRGTLYVVSHTNSAIYEISSQPQGNTGGTFSAQLTGVVEIPQGDPDGAGRATVDINLGRNQLCYTLTVSNIAPASAAHIHVGAAGTVGPVVVPLSPPTGGSSSGCATVDSALLKAIKSDPANYYVNVHNAAFPGGAVRGQLAE